MRGISAPSGGFHPPFSLLNGSPLHSGHALPSPFFSLLSTPDGSPLHSGHALLPQFFSLLPTFAYFVVQKPPSYWREASTCDLPFR